MREPKAAENLRFHQILSGVPVDFLGLALGENEFHLPCHFMPEDFEAGSATSLGESSLYLRGEKTTRSWS